jgi:hypothetical protein
MESFEIIINDEIYVIVHNGPEMYTFTVFNYATCHVMKKCDSGKWEAIEHRFGIDYLPLNELGEAIDQHYIQQKLRAGNILKQKSA